MISIETANCPQNLMTVDPLKFFYRSWQLNMVIEQENWNDVEFLECWATVYNLVKLYSNAVCVNSLHSSTWCLLARSLTHPWILKWYLALYAPLSTYILPTSTRRLVQCAYFSAYMLAHYAWCDRIYLCYLSWLHMLMFTQFNLHGCLCFVDIFRLPDCFFTEIL